MKYVNSYQIFIVYSSILILLVVLGLALSFGSYKVTFIDYLYSDMSKVQESVFTKIRFPRVLLSAFVGASLATSGACLQGLFRNPFHDINMTMKQMQLHLWEIFSA